MDQAVTQWLNSAAGTHGVRDAIMIAVTQYGVPVLVLLVALQWWTRENRTHVRHTCIAAAFSFFLGLGINQVILLFVHRIRPYDAGISHLIIAPSADWSFPSDHATASFAIAAAFLLRGLEWRGAALVAGALVVCWSRIYVGTHYVTDVLGGATTGVFAAVVVRSGYWEGTRIDRALTSIL